jgi:hypothetical protein
MLSKSDFSKPILLAGAFTCVALGWASAKTQEVCPVRSGDSVQNIDVFDGKPEELAFLAPDDGGTTTNIFTLGDIYKEGRTVTIRCKYGTGFVADVELKNKVDHCTASRSKSGHVAVICQ